MQIHNATEFFTKPQEILFKMLQEETTNIVALNNINYMPLQGV